MIKVFCDRCCDEIDNLLSARIVDYSHVDPSTFNVQGTVEDGPLLCGDCVKEVKLFISEYDDDT